LNGQSFAALEKGKHYAFEITLHRDRGNLPTKLSVGNVNIQNWEHNSLELGEVGKPAPAGENNLFEAIRNATAKDVGGTPLYTVNIGTNFDMEAAFEHPEDVSELFKQTCKGKKNKDIIGNMDVLVKLNKNINLEQSIKIKLLMDNFTGPLPNKLFKNSGQNTWLAEFSANKASSIGDSAFEQCIILNSVHLKSATQCGNKSFYYNSDLTSVFLPLVKKIGNNAFETCYNLSTVDFPSATSLGDMALRFTEINNPNLPKILSIGNEAFSYCKNLTRLNLPLAEKIGRIPFIGSGLKTLKLGTTNIITTDLLTKTDHEDAIEPSSIVLYLNGKEYQQANKENSEWKGMKWLAILPYETEK
ncbi:MAG: leucine-rich repeat domain-containing protein, partial [Cytophagales bacterium]|nr:leucine-rich repeat domain-containing protein [Cytophagales bacterium]